MVLDSYGICRIESVALCDVRSVSSFGSFEALWRDATVRMVTSENHWQQVFSTKAADEVSWFQEVPEVSIRLIEKYSTSSSRVIDVGAGESLFVDQLISRGYSELTVVDISASAIEDVKTRLIGCADGVQFEVADVRQWKSSHTFDVWHDRAAFHFMNSDEDVASYVRVLQKSLVSGGFAIIGTFAENGPTHCSGLEVRRYSTDQINAEFSDGFSLVETESEEHLTPWGAVQYFTWAVLRRH